jgi:hypothetical protein
MVIDPQQKGPLCGLQRARSHAHPSTQEAL